MKKLVGVASFFLAIAILSGCGSNESVEEVKEDVEVEEEYVIVGVESDEAIAVLISNETGKNITEIRIKSDAEAEFPANMMATDIVLSDKEEAKLYYNADAAQTSVSSDAGDMVVNPTYQMQLTFEDGTQMVLSNFSIEDIDEKVTLHAEDVLYITYEDKEGNSVNTKEHELAYKAQVEAEVLAQEQAALQAQQEAEAAAQQQQAEATTQSQPVVQEQVVTPAPETTTVPDANVGQDTEQCLPEDQLVIKP